MPPSSESAESNSARVREARRRLNVLEVEIHRIRAELARLEADGEDAAAERLEQELLRHEQDHDRERRFAESSGQPFDHRPGRPGGFAGHNEEQKRDDWQATEPTSSLAASESPLRKATKPASRARKRRSRGKPVWAVSLALHAVFLAMLGVAGFATVGPPAPQLEVSATENDPFLDELAEIEFDELTPDVLQTVEPELDDLQAEFDPIELDSTEFDAEVLDLADFQDPLRESETVLVSPVAFDAPPSDFGTLAANANPGGGAGEGRGARARGGQRGDTRFFGARGRGDGFVFVVDNSGTMKHGRLETTLIEIQRSVFSLSEDQRFHVLFFSDQAYPMFFPQPVEGLVPATRENKRKLAAWLSTVEMCVGGRLIDAMELAESMRPDTVFLLSDGGISSGTMRYMTADHDWGFSVNTLGMTVKKPVDSQKLMAIANAQSGQYMPVAVNPVAARMAQQRPIPYRNTTSGPGPVWGSKVPGPR